MSLAGVMHKEPRVFAHDMIPLSRLDGGSWNLGDPIKPKVVLPSPPSDPISYYNEKKSVAYESTAQPGTTYRAMPPGFGLYVGVAGSVTVITEAGEERVIPGVQAGTFLPVLVLSVVALAGPTTADVLVIV